MKSEALFALLGDMEERYVTAAEQPVKKQRHWRVLVPVAACAVLAIAAIPMLRTLKSAPLHSYTVSGLDVSTTTDDAFTYNTAVTAGGGAEGDSIAFAAPATADEDQPMTADELRRALPSLGFTEADIEDFLALGYDMTWVQWWQFHDSCDAGDCTVEALTEYLDARMHQTGEFIGGALAPDPSVPAEDSVTEAYQNLMAHFDAECGPGNFPDWYGGAYIVNGNYLIVNIVNSYDEALANKDFYFEIMDWCGSTSVGFGGSKYSLNELRALQQQVTALPELAALESWGCGVDEMDGVLELDVPTADKALLKALARLDPEDDAIVVNVGMAFGLSVDD